MLFTTQTFAVGASRARGSVLLWLRLWGYQRTVLAMVILLFVAMQVPQVREFLLIYRLPAWPAIWELCFVFLSALSAWYAGRLAFSINPAPDRQGSALEIKSHRRLRKWLPRMYALFVPLAPAVACWQLGLPKKAALYVALAVCAALLVWARRPLVRRFHLDEGLQADPAEDAVATQWADVPRTQWAVIAGAAAMALLLVALASVAPEVTAAWVGTTGVLFLSGAVVMILVTAVLQAAVRARVPLVLITVCWLVLVALVPAGKLHWVEDGVPRGEQIAAATGDDGSPGGGQILTFGHDVPVLLAAEGGGIRAAYWTALTMHTLDILTDGALRENLALASGISGGSLGLATYALSADAGLVDGACADSRIDADVPLLAPLNVSHCMLSDDFLGAVVLRMLWLDSLRLALPVDFPTDRGRALEAGWAGRWLQVTGRDDFREPLARLAGSSDTYWVFNTTQVETGRRVVQSAPPIESLNAFSPAAIDGRTIFGSEIRLDRAIHNSARFTYVSPAGAARMRAPDTEAQRGAGRQESVTEFVDGGYFENSGLTLINDWIANTKSSSAGDGWFETRALGLAAVIDSGPPPDRHPLVVLISNDPAVAPPEVCAPEKRGSRESAPASARSGADARRWHSQVIAPITGLLETRVARGEYARRQASALIGETHFAHIGLRKGDVAVPLGWALSNESIAEMQFQMWCRATWDLESPLIRAVVRLQGNEGVARDRLDRLCRSVPPAPRLQTCT